jgi:hypothetical protein
MNAEEIKGYVASHFRYEQQVALIAFEAPDHLGGAYGELADVMVVTDHRLLYEIEVKITIADLKRDVDKHKHTGFKNGDTRHPVSRFYFAVPKEIWVPALEIIENIYPYAGLLSVNGGFVELQKRAKDLHGKRLSLRQIYQFTKQQSGTLCRLALAAAKSSQVAEERWKDVLQLRKELALQKAINSALEEGNHHG